MMSGEFMKEVQRAGATTIPKPLWCVMLIKKLERCNMSRGGRGLGGLQKAILNYRKGDCILVDKN